MKTVTNGIIVKRVDDLTAQKIVGNGWAYCSKRKWKELFERASIARNGIESVAPLSHCFTKVKNEVSHENTF